MTDKEYVAIIDFGSQTTMLIARRIRELGVMAKVLSPSTTALELKAFMPSALILSGGPDSLLDSGALRIDPALFSLKLPILGICYGMQLMVDHFGGCLTKAKVREFGRRKLELKETSKLFKDLPDSFNAWMSHCDQVELKDAPFKTMAQSASCPHAAIEHETLPLFGVQFHPEVSHSEYGTKLLHNFIFSVAHLSKNFILQDFLANSIEEIKKTVGDAEVLLGLSGGVDSSVAAALVEKAIGEKLHCVYVNHGLHREGEVEEVKRIFGELLGAQLHVVDAEDQFFKALKGVTDPELKRKNIGRVFVEVFEKEALRFKNVKFLGQGTLYPDVIESSAKKGPSHAIKTHHNVGGLPERMNLKLLEPLRDLFKDEVRSLGKLLGLSDTIVHRQPFPGPGLAVRIPMEVTKERVALLRKADAIVLEVIENAYQEGILKEKMWQWFAILLPVKSVGVMGDARSYGETIAIRCVESTDAMTADWCRLPYELLSIISSRITNEVPGISRVLYDITQKPPGTIEWE